MSPTPGSSSNMPGSGFWVAVAAIFSAILGAARWIHDLPERKRKAADAKEKAENKKIDARVEAIVGPRFDAIDDSVKGAVSELKHLIRNTEEKRRLSEEEKEARRREIEEEKESERRELERQHHEQNTNRLTALETTMKLFLEQPFVDRRTRPRE